MAASCNTVPWSSLPVATTINSPDGFLVMQNGAPVNVSWETIMAMLNPSVQNLPIYKNHAEAAAAGITAGVWWRASANNTMGLPPGTAIQML